MAILDYKCPACGGSLAFDSELQKLKCTYCETPYDVEEFEGTSGGNPHDWQPGETDGLRVYSCSNCGGQIVGDETLASSKCPYCDSPVIMVGQFEGDLRPDYVIPFKLDKKKAVEEFKKHLLDKKLLPAAFRDENRIEEIKGVYVPFWLVNAKVLGDLNLSGYDDTKWRAGDYVYTETKKYEISRRGYIEFENVPVDGSSRIDDDMMESIEPFDFGEAVPFNTGYLVGYMADRYDVPLDETIGTIEERISVSALEKFKSTVRKYDVLRSIREDIQIEDSSYSYALYPVWLLNVKWNGDIYLFAMNGQTGKFIGNLPEDKGLARKMFWKWYSIFGIGLGMLSAILSLVF